MEQQIPAVKLRSSGGEPSAKESEAMNTELIAFSADEPEEVYPAEAVATAAGGRARLHLIDGADHFYSGVEEGFVAAVREWFRQID